MSRAVSLLGLPLGLLHASPAAAQQEPNLALDRYTPAPAGDRFFGLSDADAPQHLHMDAWLVLDYAHNPLVVEYANPDGSTSVDKIVAHQLFAHVGGAIGLWSFLKLDLSIPVALYQKGSDPSVGGGTFQSPSGVDFGDIRLGARAEIWGHKKGYLSVGAGAYLWLPTGASSSGSFTSDGTVRGLPQVMASGQIGSFLYAFSTGVDLRGGQDYGGTVQGSRWQINGAAGFVFGPDDTIQLGPEANLALTFDDIARETTNSEILLGGKWRFLPAFVVGLGGGAGLAGGAGTPDARGLFSFAFSPRDRADTDGDGILDQADACPERAGVTHADPKKNGCPPDTDGDGIIDDEDSCRTVAGQPSTDPAQNGCPDIDGDRIIDRLDACPDLAGVRSQDTSKNGCPADKDQDGIYDEVDACPDVPGVHSEDPKTDGCPPDRDRDSILDAEDSCPDEPGTKSQDPALNGCPDRDHDGITDSRDACPDRRGRPSEDPAKNGCPVVEVSTDRIVILQKVQFAVGSAEIDPVSFSLLDDIAQVLREHDEIQRVEIQGHTDDRGSSWLNTRLSKDRAASVRQALLDRGIDGSRLTSKGFGPTVPLATNKTDEGREKNRRVEFKITSSQRGASKSPKAGDAQ